MAASTQFWDPRMMLMALLSRLFDDPINLAAKALSTGVVTANNIFHMDLKLDHATAYERMGQLLDRLGAPDAKQQLADHARAGDSFFPARNTFAKLLQAEKRAKFLTDQQYATFEAIRRSNIDTPRLTLQGHPSCGKTFLLVRLAAERAMQEGSQRILLLSHSPLLQQHIARSGCAACG